MKTLLRTLALVFLLTSPALASDHLHDAPTLLDTIPPDSFVLKSGRPLKGAIVEVHFSNGDLIALQKLTKRKLVIRFRDAKPGLYTITIMKNELVQEYHFVKTVDPIR